MFRSKLPLALVILCVVSGLGAVMVPRTTGPTATPALLGTTLSGIRAPGFTLRDQWGKSVSLRQFRGRPVLLTFMESNCTQLCPVVTETIRRALAETGGASSRIAVLAVSTDPEHDTPASVRRYSRRHGMLYRWHYLTSSRHVLKPVWNGYHLYVAPASASPQADQQHTSATYLIDASGREQVLMGGDPVTSDLVTDLRVMLGEHGIARQVSRVAAPQTGHPAPDFALADLSGRHIDLRSLRGRVVVLNFWATWCTACKSEVPRLESWYRQLRSRGVVVLGVDEQEGRPDVQPYAQKYGMTYPVVLDGDGSVGASYDVTDLPRTLVIDRHGIVQAVKLGILTQSDLAAHVIPQVSA